MAGFRKDKTGVAQTAANAASVVTAALVTAGVLTDAESANEHFNGLRGEVFTDLAAVVDADNEMFAEVESSAPASGGSRRSSGGGQKKSSISLEDAQGTALGFGKFGSKDDEGKANGVTLGELESMSKSECEKYGYESGNGLKYLEYLSKNENNDFIARRARVILEARKASSDE